MLKRRLVTVAIAAALMAPLVPLGTPAQASQCASPIQMFVWYGAQVPGQTNPTTNPVSINVAALACIPEEDGVSLDAFVVYPGATFVSGRDNSAACVDIEGHIEGLGANNHTLWTKPVSSVPGGGCNPEVGTTGASSKQVAIDPTQLGTITARTSNGSVQFHTIDQI